MAQQKYAPIIGFSVVSLMLYGWIAYGIERSDFVMLITSFGMLFGIYYFLVRGFLQDRLELKWGVALAVLFRVVLLLAIPNLSDDFYRFIWDGNLFASGINPFLETPEFYKNQEALTSLGISSAIFEGLNSSGYYTVYPPVCQYIFWLGAQIFQDQIMGNIILMRLFIMGAEIGTLFILKKLLERFNLNPVYVLVYALNPLVILELTGNLHFEGIMIFFLVAAYYFFLQKRYWPAAVLFLLAVNTKLIPLLLIPYLVFSLDWRKSAGLIAVLTAGTLLLHIPFLDQAFVSNFGDSLGLYFQSFEFNASIYYLVRWVGYQVEGYNIIQQAGPYLAAISTVIMIGVSWRFKNKKLENLPYLYIGLLTIYYLFSTTVHPWYITTMIVFVPLSGMLYPLAWSALIPLTYATYLTSTYTENLWLVALEYLIVFSVLGYEWYRGNWNPSVKLDRIFINKQKA
ncbi:MAG: glycosyltransferase 87 family protein [Balneolaceae bacterium]|nr:glycosyltransferase 87 family protein [Balneolaceae bacterium]